MLEVAFFALAVGLFYRALRRLNPNAAAVVKPEPPTRAAGPLEYANRLYREKRFAVAEKAYLQVLKFDHKNLTAYSRLGLIYAGNRSYDEAIECLQMVAQMSPSATSWRNLGSIYAQNNNWVKAIAAYDKAIMFEPTTTTYLLLAKAYNKVANRPKMIVALELAVKLDASKKNLGLLAEAYVSNHERIKAEETYRRLLEVDPSDPKALRMVGTTQPS